MTPSITSVRPLARGDEGDWRRLWADYLAFYETTRPESVFRATFARLLSADEPMFALAATQGDRVIGIAHAILHRHCWSEADTCYLQDLYVDADARSHGAGRALIEAVYAQADRLGAISVYWLTQEFNYRGRMLYDRVGQRTPFIKYQRP
ncbi:MAG: GNAT family N-acetyltransferase [Rhodobacterales bacterium CG_4_9_14_3_um_filter_71_31]|nr:MAG: GNAT family N-acetyltransferase [Rhodobacterales bacterium CG_4_9_14_3_um_filter_71_31]